jgi:hypothetical protein
MSVFMANVSSWIQIVKKGRVQGPSALGAERGHGAATAKRVAQA